MTGMLRRFVHDAPAPRVVFGVGALSEVQSEAHRLGGQRILVISTGSAGLVADQVSDSFADRVVGRIDKVAMHVPADAADAAVRSAEESECDLLVCLGGGSAIGLAKAIARASGLPILAVPTTYAGSEMTSIWGRTEAGVKTTGRDESVRPRTVIYDPVLTVGLPRALSAASGMNAVAHAMEALYAPNATPATTRLAKEGLQLLASSLPRVVDTPTQIEARSDALYGAWLCGRVLDATQMGLHHRICHVLGGTYGLSHSAVHSAVLPYVVSWAQSRVPEAMQVAATALDASEPGAALWDLATRIGAPTSLEEVGFGVENLVEAAMTISKAPPVGPREATFDDVCQILSAASVGARPDPSTFG